MSGVDSNFDPAHNEIELELELIPRNHESPSPDSNPALELKHHYSPLISLQHYERS